MRLLVVTAIVVAANSSVSIARALRLTSVCHVVHDAPKLIGKQVRVEGYIFNLGSHGLVLVDKREDCKGGQLALWTDHVASSAIWQRAFAQGLRPKQAILVGTVRWQAARFTNGRNPGLTIEQIEYLSRRDADPKDF